MVARATKRGVLKKGEKVHVLKPCDFNIDDIIDSMKKMSPEEVLAMKIYDTETHEGEFTDEQGLRYAREYYGKIGVVVRVNRKGKQLHVGQSRYDPLYTVRFGPSMGFKRRQDGFWREELRRV